jgi:hypothetical protein
VQQATPTHFSACRRQKKLPTKDSLPTVVEETSLMLVANNKTIADENVNIGDDNEVKSVKNADIVEDNSNKDKDSNKEEGTNIGKDNDNKDYKYEDSDIDKDKGEEFNDEGQTNKDKGNKDEVSVFGDFFLLYFSPLFIHPLISGNLNHHILL